MIKTTANVLTDIYQEKGIANLIIQYLDSGSMIAIYSDPIFIDMNGQIRIDGRNKLTSYEEKSLYLTKFTPHRIIQVAAGYDFILYLDEIGEVYAHGDNSDGQLGIGSKEGYNCEYGPDGLENGSEDPGTISSAPIHPVRIEALVDKRICQIAAGNSHSVFLTNTGEVWGCGRNSGGVLGINYCIYYSLLPVRNESLVTICIKNITAGCFHNLFLDDVGEIFGSGLNCSGCLGMKNKCQYTRGHYVMTNKKIISMAAGSDHTLFLDINGRVWVDKVTRKGMRKQ